VKNRAKVDWSQRGHVLVTRDDQVVYGRVVGQGNMNNCAPFQAYCHDCQRQGYQQFVLDFSGCQGIDSTFLGLLVGIALGEGDQQRDVVVLNTNDYVRKILREVGVDRLVTVCPDELALPDVPMRRLEPIEADPRDRASMILQAHVRLCEIDASNQDRFGHFIALLRSELQAISNRTGQPAVTLNKRPRE